MAKKIGYCHNYGECDLADSKQPQEVESTEFICEECHKPLFEKDGGHGPKPGGKGKLIALIAAVVVVLGGGGFLTVNGIQKAKEKKAYEAYVADSIAKAEEAARLQAEADSIAKAAAEAAAAEAARIQAEADSIAAAAEAARQQEIADSIAKAEEEAARLKEELDKKKNAGNGTLTLSYGKYTGATKNGYPHGQGRLTYTKSRQINKNDTKARKANPGDYVIGEFYNGFVVYGKHYDSKGNLLGSLNFGVGNESDHDSK